MTSYIPEDKISEIRHATDIVDIISEIVLLKRAGKNYVGLCPFHSEKTPSFTVSPDKQIFYCFGCATGGNVFSFLMKHEGLAFPEAVKMLAGRYGVALPVQPMSAGQKQRFDEKENVLAVNRLALEFYRRQLTGDVSGQAAMQYLKQRSMGAEVMEHFQLGFAPAEWGRLVDFFYQKKISPALAEKAGLIVSKKNRDGFYDRFRNRIIFPIFDVNMRPIGFGGRAIDDSEPKYLNSPETPVYNKRRSLYGIHRAKRPCRESGTVYIVEGYFDLLVLHQYGIENAVATLGTALTQDHIRILKGYAGRAVLVYDSDDAGIKAALRSAEIFMQEEMDARIMVLPAGHDPDSFLLEFGLESFMQIASEAGSVMNFLMDSAVQKHGLSVEGKIRIVRDMIAPLCAISDNVAKTLYVKELAERIDVDESAVRAKVRERSFSGRDNLKPADRFYQKNLKDRDNPLIQAGTRGLASVSKWSRLERQIIMMMLQYPAIIDQIRQRNLIELFEDTTMKSIGELVLSHQDSQGDRISEIISSSDDPRIKSQIARLAIGEDLWDRDSCLNILARFESRRKRNANTLIEQIKAAEKNNDVELLKKLLAKKQKQAVIHEQQKMTQLK